MYYSIIFFTSDFLEFYRIISTCKNFVEKKWHLSLCQIHHFTSFCYFSHRNWIILAPRLCCWKLEKLKERKKKRSNTYFRRKFYLTSLKSGVTLLERSRKGNLGNTKFAVYIFSVPPRTFIHTRIILSCQNSSLCVRLRERTDAIC